MDSIGGRSPYGVVFPSDHDFDAKLTDGITDVAAFWIIGGEHDGASAQVTRSHYPHCPPFIHCHLLGIPVIQRVISCRNAPRGFIVQNTCGVVWREWHCVRSE
ncbi:hypothetical protein BDN71DRAFT_679470 [Pleurotus eryngii]|uniref:Uncharacterized protein n=1 Tax=Pleurotus eryngii TaxID=5323 RepID=A0A9P6D813_PLEER|nr:hypothetical protein BDN71DRAFT_679470 [Pleurotus eryngii]